MKKLMILGASVLQIPAILQAKKMGIYVIAVDMNPNAEGFSYADKKIVVSTTDIDGVLKEARNNNIDGIMTIASDRPMMTVAKVCEELDLVGIDMKTAINATNKSKMRDALRNNDVAIPMYFSVESYKDFLEASKKIIDRGYNCIVKPSDNSGSRGIRLVKDSDNLDEVYSYCKENSIAGTLVVEEYMEGEEVSVESISHDGDCEVIQITDKITTGAPYFVEMGHTQPSMLSDETKDEIKKLTQKATKAIGITDGPSHTEIKVTKDGPKIVEIGARLGGDNITTHLVPLSTGVNMVEVSIKIALGEEISLRKTLNMASAIRYKDCKQGKIIAINGVDEAKKVQNIKEIKIVHGPGEISSEIRNSNDRICYSISQADTTKEAIKSCEEALEKIVVEIEE